MVRTINTSCCGRPLKAVIIESTRLPLGVQFYEIIDGGVADHAITVCPVCRRVFPRTAEKVKELLGKNWS